MSARPAATRALSSDSIAASAATVAAAGSSAAAMGRSSAGSAGTGSVAGISPITASGAWSRAASTETTTMPSRDPGIEGWSFGARTMQATTTATAPSAYSR